MPGRPIFIHIITNSAYVLAVQARFFVILQSFAAQQMIADLQTWTEITNNQSGKTILE
jgi:hypothetical protein